jgi:lipoprotein-anchoring transpeptidase ErfK/SrfK
MSMVGGAVGCGEGNGKSVARILHEPAARDNRRAFRARRRALHFSPDSVECRANTNGKDSPMPLTPLDDIYRERRFPWPAAVLGALVLAAVLWFFLRPGRGKEGGADSAATNEVAAVPASSPAAAQPAVSAGPVVAGDLSEEDFRKALADAKALDDQGKLYDEREVLLAALAKAGSDFAPALERSIGALSTRIYLEPRPGPDKVEYVVKGGDALSAIASRFVCPKELIMEANGIKDPTKIRPGQRLVFPDHPDFAVRVSKSLNTLELTLGGKFFKKYVVGTGQNAKTPAGTFLVKDKIEHPDWWSESGKVIPYGDPANVLGTHWLALEATGETPRVSGYGIHGTWDDTTLGRQSSAGCVRMSNADVRELFLFLPRKTPVTIVE